MRMMGKALAGGRNHWINGQMHVCENEWMDEWINK